MVLWMELTGVVPEQIQNVSNSGVRSGWIAMRSGLRMFSSGGAEEVDVVIDVVLDIWWMSRQRLHSGNDQIFQRRLFSDRFA